MTLLDENTEVLRFPILVDLLDTEVAEVSLVIIEDCKYELNCECLEVSLLCILLEYFNEVVQREVIVAINAELACVSIKTDDVVLSKAEEKDDVLLFSLLLEMALLEENTLVVNFPIFVDVLNSEIKELDVCTRCVVPLVADSIV